MLIWDVFGAFHVFSTTSRTFSALIAKLSSCRLSENAVTRTIRKPTPSPQPIANSGPRTVCFAKKRVKSRFPAAVPVVLFSHESRFLSFF
jgi:hypothetical protein